MCIKVRDKARIRSFCDRLAAAWEEIPDMRFGQLVINLVHTMEQIGIRPFYLEDGPMLEAIEVFCSRNRPSQSLAERAMDYDGELGLAEELGIQDKPSGDEVW